MPKNFTDWNSFLAHHGIKGQKWGVQHGPPYPLDDKTSSIVRMKSVHESYGDSIQDDPHRFKHQKETLDSLKKLSKNADIEQIRRNINSPDDEGVYSDVGRSYNCPNCAAAFEMIERGYEVRARTAPDGSNVGDITSYFKGGSLSKSKSNPEIDNLVYPRVDQSAYEKARFKFQRDRMLSKESKDRIQYEKKVNEYQTESITNFLTDLHKQDNGSRGIIVVGWRMTNDLSNRTRAYHALNYKVINDKVVFYDTQSHRSYKQNGYTDTEWLYGCDPRELYHMRTDNIDVSPNITKAVYSHRDKKR